MNFRLVDFNKSKHSNTIGKESLSSFRQKIMDIRHSGNEDKIEVDLRDAKINDMSLKTLAELKALYHVDYINTGIRKNEIDKYVDTYYFIKEYLGVENYIDWITKKIREADYPLMILDNRLNTYNKENNVAELSIIQPLSIRNNELIYNRLRTYYTQPKHLVEKINEDGLMDIWVRESIKLVDLGSLEIGLRFASNEVERTLLDIIKEIIEKSRGEYLRGDK